MTIDQAIKELHHCYQDCNLPLEAKRADAINLGIEALKWRQLMEKDYGSWCGPLLPGETEN